MYFNYATAFPLRSCTDNRLIIFFSLRQHVSHCHIHLNIVYIYIYTDLDFVTFSLSPHCRDTNKKKARTFKYTIISIGSGLFDSDVDLNCEEHLEVNSHRWPILLDLILSKTKSDYDSRWDTRKSYDAYVLSIPYPQQNVANLECISGGRHLRESRVREIFRQTKEKLKW